MREAIETQKRQYKAQQEAELAKAPRTEHQNIKNRLRDEREYKCGQLYESYKQIMDDLVTQQNVSYLTDTELGYLHATARSRLLTFVNNPCH